MAVKIRLRRAGRKKAPSYRIVVADSRSPRDGKFIEIIGQYAPRTGEQALNLKSERVNYWLDSGAQPTDNLRAEFVGVRGIENSYRENHVEHDRGPDRRDCLTGRNSVVLANNNPMSNDPACPVRS